MRRSSIPAILLILCVSAPAMAGNLEPSSPPGPTMKTLDEIPPTWSRRLASNDGSTSPLYLGCDSSRFDCVLHSGSPIVFPQGVLDRETGLVWERTPNNEQLTWADAVRACHYLDKGGRKGWRLPTVEELSSLIDSSQMAPALPEGNPFTGVHDGSIQSYWTQTLNADDSITPFAAWAVRFFEGDPVLLANTSDTVYVWCVRGGYGTGGI